MVSIIYLWTTKQNGWFWNNDVLDHVLMWPRTSSMLFSVSNFLPPACPASNNFGWVGLWDRSMIFTPLESLIYLLSNDLNNSIFWHTTHFIRTCHISKQSNFSLPIYVSFQRIILRCLKKLLIDPHSGKLLMSCDVKSSVFFDSVTAWQGVNTWCLHHMI